MIKSRERPNAIRKEIIDESIVEVESLWIWRSTTRGEHTRPRDREAITFDAEGLHQLNVLLVTMIVIVGDITVCVGHNLTRSVRKSIPDGFTAAVFLCCALYLI